MVNPQKIASIDTAELHFDPENPRFYRLNKPSTEEVIEEMFDDEGVQELMLSIGQKGYFQGEPLLVVPDKEGRLIVVEGNRRLAATKLLNGQIPPPSRRHSSVKHIQDEAKYKPFPLELPCITYPTRRDVLAYLGYRHITGIKQWDSLSKARYLKQLRDEFYPKVEKQAQLKALANDIGSKPDYVGKLLTALALYDRAEGAKFFDLPIHTEHVEFSYITTALNYRQLSDWLGLDNPTDIDMPNLNVENLKNAFAWMFSKDQQGKTILGESRNLGDLACIVESRDAIAVLKDSGSLAEAYLYTDGPQNALQKIMEQADERLYVIWNMLQKTKPFTPSHADMALAIFDRSKDIKDFIRQKLED